MKDEYVKVKEIDLGDILDLTFDGMIDELIKIKEDYPKEKGYKISVGDYYVDSDNCLADLIIIVSKLESEDERLKRLDLEKKAQHKQILNEIERMEKRLDVLKLKLG